MRPFLKVPDVELRLITKALFACWSLTEGDCLVLEDVEMLRLKQMLNTDLVVPFSFHGLSFEVLFTMMQHLAKVPQNALLFIEKDIQSGIADLSERLLGSEQEMAMELLWFLMQTDGDAVVRDTVDNRDSTEPGPEAEQDHQQVIGGCTVHTIESVDSISRDFPDMYIYVIHQISQSKISNFHNHNLQQISIFKNNHANNFVCLNQMFKKLQIVNLSFLFQAY